MPRSPRLTGLCAVSDSCCNCAGSELRRLPLRSEVRKPLVPVSFPPPYADILMVHPCHEPASDVAASGNSGEIVEFAQQPELRESLKDSKVKCGASDAAPGKSQPDQAVGRIPGVLFGFKPLKPAASNLLELTVQDMADSNSRDIETQSFSLVSWNTFGGAGRLRRRKSCYQRVAIRR